MTEAMDSKMCIHSILTPWLFTWSPMLMNWAGHRRSEKLSERRKREYDGFLRGVIISTSLSRAEAVFKIGRYKFDRLRDLNPNIPIPKKRPNDNVINSEYKEFVRIFMKVQ